MTKLISFGTLACIACNQAHAFVSPPLVSASIPTKQSPYNIIYVTDDSSSANNEATLINPADMRLREIQNELKERNVSYADCFDRESLVKRLGEARENHPVVTVTETKDDETSTSQSAETLDPKPEISNFDDNVDGEGDEFDRGATIDVLRELRVKELKEKLSEYKVRWGTMIEKEEMVQALCNAMEERFNQSKNFSRGGSIIPGEVTDVTEAVLIEELGWLESDVSRGVATTADGGEQSHSPIVLDVYATWCGPCKFVAPQLEAAAQDLGPKVRFMKIDSDKHQRIASILRIGGLPTLLYFDGGSVSKEIKRVEGALMKDQIIDFVNECGAMSR
jgi:thioredoxin